MVDDNIKERMSEARRAEQMVDHAVQAFPRLRCRVGRSCQQSSNCERRWKKLRRDEIERNRKHLGPMSLEQQEAVDRLTRSMINKILHHAISQLKDMAHHPDGPEYVELVRKIFNVKDR